MSGDACRLEVVQPIATSIIVTTNRRKVVADMPRSYRAIHEMPPKKPHKPQRRDAPRQGATDWGGVADWYDQLVGEAGSEYHREVVLPGVVRLLNPKAGEKMIDVACGQGVLCRLLHERGVRADQRRPPAQRPGRPLPRRRRARADVPRRERLRRRRVRAGNPEHQPDRAGIRGCRPRAESGWAVRAGDDAPGVSRVEGDE